MEPRASSVAAVAAAALVLAAGAHAQARLVTDGYPYASSCPQAGDRDDVDRWKMNTCNCTSYAAWALWRNGYRTDWFVRRLDGRVELAERRAAARDPVRVGGARRCGGRVAGVGEVRPHRRRHRRCTATAPSTWRSTTCPADVRSSGSTGARPSRRDGVTFVYVPRRADAAVVNLEPDDGPSVALGVADRLRRCGGEVAALDGHESRPRRSARTTRRWWTGPTGRARARIGWSATSSEVEHDERSEEPREEVAVRLRPDEDGEERGGDEDAVPHETAKSRRTTGGSSSRRRAVSAEICAPASANAVTDPTDLPSVSGARPTRSPRARPRLPRRRGTPSRARAPGSAPGRGARPPGAR